MLLLYPKMLLKPTSIWVQRDSNSHYNRVWLHNKVFVIEVEKSE